MFRHINQDRVASSKLKQLSRFPWFDSNDLNDLTPKMQLNSVFCHEATGNWFMYVRANEALANGQLVYRSLPATETVLNTGGTLSTLALVYLSSAGLTVNAEVGNWIYLENGGVTPGPTIAPIKANAATTVTISQRDMNSTLNQNDADSLSAALTSSTNAAIIRPGLVNVCTATKVPIGVALATVTTQYYTIIQVAGLALVQAVGSGVNLVSGVPAVPSAAGVIIGTASPAYAVGHIVPIFAFTGAGPELVPVNLNLLGNL